MKYGKSQNGIVHLLSAVNSEFTLCGDAFDIDAIADGVEDGLAWVEVRRGPVTCPKCADQIRACRGVRVANKN